MTDSKCFASSSRVAQALGQQYNLKVKDSMTIPEYMRCGSASAAGEDQGPQVCFNLCRMAFP